ncbi:MAG TPA: adenylate/guanylate cyclase domain-containing protein [Chitinophagales bacterium]|nr:adenylate/guanylate cyclase domain-containing protein [Chitinophagales bacterium]
MSRGRRIQFAQLLAIILAWQIVALFITGYDYSLTHATDFQPFSEKYPLGLNIIFNGGGAFFGALIAGSFIVFYLNVKFRDKPYGYSILAICLLYIITVILVHLAIGFFWVPQASGIQVGDPGFKQGYWKYLRDPYHIKDIMAWSVVTALTQFVLLMNNKFGHGILWDIIRGKYHLPKEETRIFMFADLNDSTTLAEKLGNERYHELLKDFFADITNPIVNNNGDIYQYIGDEVVVAWKYEDGITNNQCIRCFFDMKDEIEKHKNEYLTKYGLVPGFKAGIHFGKVITGEIGIIKRDITYSGDVLNTTSRIENKCREFDVEVIASDDLLSRLSLANQFISRQLGSFILKGKEKEIGLSTLLVHVSA